MAPHSSTLAWKISRTEEPGRLQPMGSLRVGHDSATSLSLFTSHFYALEKEMATHSSVLAWRIPGTEEPSGLPSMGSHIVGHDWSDLAAAAARTSFCPPPPLLPHSYKHTCAHTATHNHILMPHLKTTTVHWRMKNGRQLTEYFCLLWHLTICLIILPATREAKTISN